TVTVSGAGNNGAVLNTAVNSASQAVRKLLVVRWKGRMEFFGNRLTFEKNVQGEYPLMKLFCDELNIYLDQPISFLNFKQTTSPQPKLLECRGKVRFECAQKEGNKDTAFIMAEDMSLFRINPETGAFDGLASEKLPGHLTAIFLGDNMNIDLPGQSSARPVSSGLPGASGEAADSALKRVDISFFKDIFGNIRSFEATANISVNCIYLPVPNWNTKLQMSGSKPNRDWIKDNGGFILDCEKVEIAQMTDPSTRKKGAELTASGGTTIEGQLFLAKAESVRFNQLKDLVIIEGDGTADAEIYVKKTPNGNYDPPYPGQRLEYNIKTKDVQLKGISGIKVFNQ
ncbi:MAG: hypothetical protein ACRC2T_05910, partial [Thermoguttaceae bacterium]